MADKTAASEVAGTVTKLSPSAVADTVSRIQAVLSAKGIKVFAVVDHSAPSELADRYHLSDELAANLAAVDPISDAAVERTSD